jgi:hypothetical protein
MSKLDELVKDIKLHPERHRHIFEDLRKCCLIDGTLDLSAIEAHSKYVDFGYNGGVKCDVAKGPCSCGAWH